MERIKLILDTDIGGDCDDAGAMAVMHRLASLGHCEILAVTSCTSKVSGAACADAINRYFGRPDIPVGMLEEEGFNLDHDTYATALSREFEHRFSGGIAPDPAIQVLRKALAAAAGRVTLCAIGPQKNLQGLLESLPDRCSDQSGYELVRDKVSKLFIMGGYFAETSFPVYIGTTKMRAEWNIEQDVESARYVADRWPGNIVYVPYEIGAVVKTGAPLLQEDERRNPVARAYRLHAGGIRESWDPITVLCAADEAAARQYIEFEEICTISFAPDGVSFCAKNKDAKHSYAKRVIDPAGLTRRIDGLLSAKKH